MRPVPFVLTVFMLTLGWAAPSVGAAWAPSWEGPHIVDEEGDAREWNSNVLANAGRRTYCDTITVTGMMGPTCSTDEDAALANAAGSTAPPGVGENPAVDILNAAFRDSPETLSVRLTLAGLPENLSDVFRGSVTGHASPDAVDGMKDFMFYSVCWDAARGSDGERPYGCGQYAYVQVQRTTDGATASGAFVVRGTDCSPLGYCAWQVPFSVTPGTPGHVAWEIPRDLLPPRAEDGRDELWQPRALVKRMTEPFERQLHVASDVTGGRASSPQKSEALLDWAHGEPGVPVELATLREPPKRVGGRNVDAVDAEGDVENRPTRKDLDVLRLRLATRGTNYTIAMELAEVDEQPADHALAFAMGVPSGGLLEGGYDARDGVRSPAALACATVRCDHLRPVPVALEVTPGAPGWVNFSVPREALGNPEVGERTRFFYASTQATPGLFDGERVGPVPHPPTETDVLAVRSGEGYDWTGFAPVQRFGSILEIRPAAGEEAGRRVSAFFADEQNDVTMPRPYGDASALQTAPAVGWSPDHYDLTYVEARRDDGNVVVTVGVRDLSETPVPEGYDALVYAVGLETSDGAFLAGYYAEKGRPGVGTPPPTYFCSQDTAVFVPEDARSDPKRSGSWQETRGVLVQGHAGQGANETGDAPQAGTITFLLPEECFGIFGSSDRNSVFHLDRLAAGTFLLQRVADDMDTLTLVDGLAPRGPVDLEEEDLSEARTNSWIVRPFNIEDFWDILGVFAAVVSGGAGVALVRRKRGALRAYLAEVDRAATTHEDDARSREAALLALRTRVKGDMVRGNVTESHYMIVERRIDEHMAKARVDAVAEAFGDLPHRLVQRLGELLRDGHLSREDYRLFSALLEDTPLTEEAKQRVRRKLRYWMHQDEGDAVDDA